MKKKIITLFLCAVLLSSALFTGCTNKGQRQDDFKAAGIEYLKAGNYEEAKNNFESALDNAGYSVGERERDINFYLATAYYLLGDLDGAVKRLDSLLSYNEKDAEALFFRGSLYISQERTDAGVNDYNSALKLEPGNFDMSTMGYENLLAYGLNDAAQAYLERAVANDGSSPSQKNGKGRMLLILGRYDEAIAAFEEAAALGSAEALLYESAAMAGNGDTEGAAAKRESYLSKNKEPSLEAYALLAEIASTSGDYVSALSYVAQALYPEGVDEETLKERLSKDPASVRALRRTEIAALEFSGEFTKAYERAVSYTAQYPADTAAVRELQFLETRKAG